MHFREIKHSTLLNSCMPFILWKSWPLLSIILQSKINLWTKTTFCLDFSNFPHHQIPRRQSCLVRQPVQVFSPYIHASLFLQHLTKQRTTQCKSFLTIHVVININNKNTPFLRSQSMEWIHFLFQIQELCSSVGLGREEGKITISGNEAEPKWNVISSYYL